MLFLRRFLSLFVVFALALSVTASAKTVSSECDVSDINVPFTTTDTKTEIGGNLQIKAKSAILLEPYTG